MELRGNHGIFLELGTGNRFLLDLVGGYRGSLQLIATDLLCGVGGAPRTKNTATEDIAFA
jgi:hypothetical protein